MSALATPSQIESELISLHMHKGRGAGPQLCVVSPDLNAARCCTAVSGIDLR